MTFATAGAAPAQSVAKNLIWVGVDVVRRIRNRLAVRKLATMNDHMLADIGITRGDVDLALGLPISQDPSLQLQVWATERRYAKRRQLREARRELGGSTGRQRKSAKTT